MGDKTAQQLREEARKAYKKAEQLRNKYNDADDLPSWQEKRIDRFLDEADRKSSLADERDDSTGLLGSEPDADPQTQMKVADVESGNKQALFEKKEGQIEFDSKAYSLLEPDQRKDILSDLDEEQHQDIIHEAAFKSFLRNKGELANMTKMERKTYNTLRGDEGEFLVPETFNQELIRKLDEIVHIRNAARTIQVSTPINHFPTIESAFDSEWVTELVGDQSKIEKSDEPFGKTTFDAESMKLILKVTEELLQDSAINLQGELNREAATDFAEQEEIAFLLGNGTNQPLGLLEAGLPVTNIGSGSDHEIIFGDMSRYWIVDLLQMQTRVLEERYADEWKVGYRFWKRTDASPVDQDAFTIGQGDTVDQNDVLDMVYALKEQYRQNGSFLLHRNTIKSVRKIQDADNRFIWQPGLQEGEPDTLAGYPVMESEFMPDPEA